MLYTLFILSAVIEVLIYVKSVEIFSEILGKKLMMINWFLRCRDLSK